MNCSQGKHWVVYRTRAKNQAWVNNQHKETTASPQYFNLLTCIIEAIYQQVWGEYGETSQPAGLLEPAIRMGTRQNDHPRFVPPTHRMGRHWCVSHEIPQLLVVHKPPNCPVPKHFLGSSLGSSWVIHFSPAPAWGLHEVKGNWRWRSASNCSP